MANVTILEVDMLPSALESWQLARTPIVAPTTALTAAKLCQSLRDVSFDAGDEVFDVSPFRSIAIQIWGLAADGNTFTLDLYGWSDGGPGHHIQTMALCAFRSHTSPANTGFHASRYTHKSIRAAFAANTIYRGADTYLLTAASDYTVKNELVTPAVQIQTNTEAGFPAGFQVNFHTNRFKYFGIFCTTVSASESVGAIFKPLELRERL